MFFDVDYLLVFAEKHKIDGKQHADRVHTAGRNDPKTTPEFGPTAGLSQ